MAAYEAAMARRQLAPFSAVCFVGVFFLLRLSRSICLVTHDACASVWLGIDDTLLSHPLGREADASSALHEVTTHRTPP